MSTTNNSSNQSYANNADGFQLAGGTTPRKLTVTGADVTLTGSGTNTYTMPASTDTLVGRASTDTLTHKTISDTSNSVSAVTFTNPYKFSVWRSAALTPASGTDIIFDSITFDTSSNYSTSTGKFTVPTAGFYYLTAQLTFVTTATNGALYWHLLKNGTTYIARHYDIDMYAANPGYYTGIISGLFQLAAGDYITVHTENTSNYALDAQNGMCFFDGHLVSAT